MNPPRPSTKTTARLAERLSKLNTSVHRCIESIFLTVEGMENAAARTDWDEVRRLANLIVLDAITYGMPDLADEAKGLSHDLDHQAKEEELKRRINKISRSAKKYE